MKKQPIPVKMRALPASEGLRSERWQIDSPESLAFFSQTDKVAIHLWPFTSVAPQNATPFMYICWVVAPTVRFTTAWGVKEQSAYLEGVINYIRHMLPKTATGTFVRDDRQRIPWMRFATQIDPQALAAAHVKAPAQAEPKDRTIDDMLEFVEAVGDAFDTTLSRAISELSVPNATDAEKQTCMDHCLQIGQLCRSQEIEAVYWPIQLLTEAIDDADVYLDTIIPREYISAVPELWYPAQRIHIPFRPEDPRRKWELSGFEISAIILLPTHTDGRDDCLMLTLLQTDLLLDNMRDPDEMVPRIMTAGVGEAGAPCYKFYHWIMAGIGFMKQKYPRTPHEYTHHEHKMAKKHNRRLQPYSVMEVRKLEPKPGDSTRTTSTEHELPGDGRYTHSWFQRSHYRRLNKPRKSNGLQVIIVAEGQKCKHLPLPANAKQKITKVKR